MSNSPKHTNDASILYAGDTSLATAGAYLGGALTHKGCRFDYADSETPISDLLKANRYRLYIISDYPSDKLAAEDFDLIIESVAAGSGLLMIGGWDSFCGLAGGYADTPLAEVLPVNIATSDDRENIATPCVLEKLTSHEITDGLPFDRPPTIGGYNRFTVKADAECLLNARRLDITCSVPGEYNFAVGDSDPMLAVGSYGSGRVAAYGGDVAPHWVGGLVDWGDARVEACAEGSHDIEVGNWYVELFYRIVRWTMQQD